MTFEVKIGCVVDVPDDAELYSIDEIVENFLNDRLLWECIATPSIAQNRTVEVRKVD